MIESSSVSLDQSIQQLAEKVTHAADKVIALRQFMGEHVAREYLGEPGTPKFPNPADQLIVEKSFGECVANGIHLASFGKTDEDSVLDEVRQYMLGFPQASYKEYRAHVEVLVRRGIAFHAYELSKQTPRIREIMDAFRATQSAT